MEIGSKLKELRVLKGLTQEELADRAELSKGFISQLERDLTSPSIATLMERFRSSRTSSPSKLFDMCCKSMKGWLMIIKISFILM